MYMYRRWFSRLLFVGMGEGDLFNNRTTPYQEPRQPLMTKKKGNNGRHTNHKQEYQP